MKVFFRYRSGFLKIPNTEFDVVIIFWWFSGDHTYMKSSPIQPCLRCGQARSYMSHVEVFTMVFTFWDTSKLTL